MVSFVTTSRHPGYALQRSVLNAGPFTVFAGALLRILQRAGCQAHLITEAFREGKKKSRQRPTLARASPALPSAMEPLTSVFGMGTGVTTPLWPPAKTVSWELKRTTTYETGEARSHIDVKFERK